ncbi:MAG: hypothetical protein J6U05_04040 [Neisseriaceae bacterium]|nr:hypothetical protein [Neisseriaceae bacterium]MBO7554599.1 hypothetical protein [Neisseriaceae bacterium]
MLIYLIKTMEYYISGCLKFKPCHCEPDAVRRGNPVLPIGKTNANRRFKRHCRKSFRQPEINQECRYNACGIDKKSAIF